MNTKKCTHDNTELFLCEEHNTAYRCVDCQEYVSADFHLKKHYQKELIKLKNEMMNLNILLENAQADTARLDAISEYGITIVQHLQLNPNKTWEEQWVATYTHPEEGEVGAIGSSMRETLDIVIKSIIEIIPKVIH